MLMDDLKRAIDADPRSEYALARDAQIDRAQLLRLRHGAGLRVETAEKLADAMGYDVVLKRRSRRGRKGT
jgi:hypothetical protein